MYWCRCMNYTQLKFMRYFCSVEPYINFNVYSDCILSFLVHIAVNQLTNLCYSGLASQLRIYIYWIVKPTYASHMWVLICNHTYHVLVFRWYSLSSIWKSRLCRCMYLVFDVRDITMRFYIWRKFDIDYMQISIMVSISLKEFF